MTNNQTIDGVPRAWLEEYESLADLASGDAQMLRALLDADKVNNRQMGLIQFVEAHPIKPAAQPQGEPVLTIELTENKIYGGMHIVKWDNPGGLKEGFHRLYAEQPAPVAVVKLGTHHVLGAIHNVEGFPGVTGFQIKTLTDLLNSVITGK